MNKISTMLYSEPLVAVPPPPSRFTLDQWYLTNRVQQRTCLDQQQLADKILAECDRKMGVIDEITLMNKREVDHKMEEKIKDIEFIRQEILKQRREVFIEVDNLTTYGERIMDSMAALKDSGLYICKKCMMFREGRLGIDLCHDDVEAELLKEIDVIQGCQNMLKRTLEQSTEQVRRLRATTYFMDRDLEDKSNVSKVDEHNLMLNEFSYNLSCYHGFVPLDPANITLNEWESFTQKNLERGAKEITSARSFRAYVDTILKQTIQDLWDQFHTVNEAFRRRIEETKDAKTRLEVQHNEIYRQVNEMTLVITKMNKNLAEKENFMALAHTRLGNRAQRVGMELCRDLVETNLVNEVRELRENLAALQGSMTEAQASLRYLLKVQIQLEQDISIKTNTLKIDEVDCMSLRQSMDYHAY